jgi:hypothetical protein
MSGQFYGRASAANGWCLWINGTSGKKYSVTSMSEIDAIITVIRNTHGFECDIDDLLDARLAMTATAP